MENKKNNKVLIILLVIIIILLSVFCILLAKGVINFSPEKVNNEGKEEYNNDDNLFLGEEDADIVNVRKLSIDSVQIYGESPTSHIGVMGTIDLSYDNSKYVGVTLSGYCLGDNNEKYLVFGPGNGSNLIYNYDDSFSLTEIIPQNIEYSDGTVKSLSEINWENVEIKYCKIDKMTSILKEGTNYPETALNIEKTFEQ